MLKYIIKRLLIFIPTIIAISLFTFAISINTPGDPVDQMLNQTSNQGQAADKLASEKAYVDQRHKLGLDKPIFYFAITNGTYPDTLYRVHKKVHRETLERLTFNYGNWQDIANYYRLIKNIENELYKIPKTETNSEDLRKLRENANSLYLHYEEQKISNLVNNMEFMISKHPDIYSAVSTHFKALQKAIVRVIQNQNQYMKYKPKFIWYGFNNQYHNWITKFIQLDFGISYRDKRPVSSVLWDALRWSILISVISIIISYLIAIPLGIKTATSKGTKGEKGITATLFMLYSMPNFWIGTLLVIFLCGGDWLDLFPPAFSLGKLPETAPFMDRMIDLVHRLTLPVLCLTYPTFAFISRQMRGGMLNVIDQDYIRTARAKGLSERKVIWKHALRNSLIPIITLFANVFPVVISGSFVVEFIFSIPGMGKLTIDSLNARDYPVVFTVFMFTAMMTLIGTLISDIMYAAVDPRISFSKK